ncbi:MAG TPA: LTA synthase family protein [Hansschlegelia sp.]
MTSLLIAFALSFVVSLVVERWPPSLGSFKAPAGALAFRLVLHAGLFASAFALSWRPWHAGFVVIALSGLFGAGDGMKRRILGEPLVFSDFALVRLAIRHPRLYYADRLRSPRAIGAFAAVAAATAVWFFFEPSILPPGGGALLAIPPLAALAVWLGLRTAPASFVAQRLVGAAPDPARDVSRFGLGGAMLLHWLAWRRQVRPSPAALAAEATTPAPRPAARGPAMIVAIQSESFVDLVGRGLPGPDLPVWRSLRKRAIAWGRCRVPAEGAYTMRSEFGFLTGLPTDSLGLDALDPYLTAKAYASASLARHFRASGRRTIFIHPYDRRFFERDELMPALGFERFIDGEAFAGAERFGPYVSDAALADAVVAEIEAAREPTFIFAVTIENHGPWGPGRIEGLDDPAAQYGRHLENADRMVGRIAAALRNRPGGALLCVYGDHAPARTLHPDMPERGSADYLLWDSSESEKRRRPARDLSIDALGRLLRARS